MELIDLDYDPASLLPPFQPSRLEELADFLANYWERDVTLPLAYVEHLSEFHGGVPGKSCFSTASGGLRSVGRFFNVLQEEDLELPLIPSWRSGASPDVRLDYSVFLYFNDEKWDGRLREVESDLLPIAGLDRAGHNCRDMDAFDLLCLQFDESLCEPSVVIFDYDSLQISEAVAPSFSSFLGKLHNCGLALPEGENF